MDWVESERQAQANLGAEIPDYFRLARLTHELVAAAIATAASDREDRPPHSTEVQARLLVRISNDLRVIELATVRGYVLQSLALAATVYELSAAVAFIGDDQGRARRWEDHDDSTRTYPSPRNRRAAVSTLILALVPDISDVETAIERHEALYKVFCMAKHGNPKALRFFGVAIEGNRVQLYHGPFLAPYVTRQARFVLYRASSLVAAAAAVFVKPQLKGASARARERYRSLDEEVGLILNELRDSTPG